ncbi:TonB-dependent receptor [Flammeovirga aprica]|uniref:TonB-dependent receptor n=1 Tax=Flammeovirga aprica JL-4 TaxID=694437 RepID=A0A7X9XBW4_9BACT|nr:TonB-dependent receptor [Flammeovirga aprica]NME71172.1 TonB-dependent receptor [Flammeovirga aprica JL-4]
MLHKFILTISFLSISFILSAQEFHFYGKVIDSETKTPLAGVSIKDIENDKVITLTNDEGRFNFNYQKETAFFNFHFLGFDEKKIKIKAEKKTTVLLVPSLQELDVVDVHSHGHDELSLSGLNTKSISSYTLETQRATTISETLSKTAGVSFISTGVGISKPTVRGMAGARVVVSVDGVKLEDQQWGMDHGLSIGQSTVDEVEIAKGAATLKYGSDGLGGVIRMKSPEPLGEDKVEGSAALNYKSNNQYFGGDFKVNAQKNKFFYHLSGGYEDFGNYQVPADQFSYLGAIYQIRDGFLANTGGNIGSLKGMVGYSGDKWITSVSYSMFDQTVGLFPGATGIPTQSWIDSFGNARKPEIPRQEIIHQMLTVNSHVDTWGGILWLDLGYQNNDRKELSDPTRHGRTLDENGFVANALDLETFSTNIHFDKEGDKSKWEVGVNYEFQENKRSGYDFLIPNYMQNTIGSYGMIGLSLSNNLDLIGGLRFDYISFQSEKFTDSFFKDPPGSENPWVRAEDINNEYYNFTGSLGLKWKMFKLIEANTNIARTFRAPTANELASNGVHHGTFRHEQGNPDLNPEQGYQWDINLAYNSKKLSVSFNPYFNYYSNYIYLSASGEASPLPDAGQIYKYTESEGYFYGNEFMLDWEISPSFKFHNATEYVYAVNTDLNRSFPFIPPLSTLNEIIYTAQIKHSFFSKPFVSFNAELVQAQNRVDRNEKKTEGYAVLGFKMGTGFSINNVYGNLLFRIDNLTDNVYMRHLSRYRLLNIPEPGRNFSVSLSAWF